MEEEKCRFSSSSSHYFFGFLHSNNYYIKIYVYVIIYPHIWCIKRFPDICNNSFIIMSYEFTSHNTFLGVSYCIYIYICIKRVPDICNNCFIIMSYEFTFHNTFLGVSYWVYPLFILLHLKHVWPISNIFYFDLFLLNHYHIYIVYIDTSRKPFGVRRWWWGYFQ